LIACSRRLYRRHFVSLGNQFHERIERGMAKLTIYRRRDSEELPDLAVLVNDFRIRLTSLYASDSIFESNTGCSELELDQ